MATITRPLHAPMLAVPPSGRDDLGVRMAFEARRKTL
jgi:hypothetical protein